MKNNLVTTQRIHVPNFEMSNNGSPFRIKYNKTQSSVNTQHKCIPVILLHVSAQFSSHHQASIQAQKTEMYNFYPDRRILR